MKHKNVLHHTPTLAKSEFWISHNLFKNLLIVVVVCAGCTTKPRDMREKSEADMQEAAAVRESVLKSFRASEATSKARYEGASFQPDILNDITLSYRYLQFSNKAAAAANLGIYLSDLGYLIEFQRTEEVQRYFDACFLLANYVGMKKQFSNFVELRFSEIISGNESMAKSIGPLFREADNSSTGEEFKKMHAAALTGYYIEELYHMTQVAQATGSSVESNMPALQSLQTLISQKEQVNHLIGYFDHIQLKSEGIAVYQDMLTMQGAYQALDLNLLKEKDPLVILADVQVRKIVELIVSVRNRITEL